MSSFGKKAWKDTIAEYPTRRVLHNVSTDAEEIVTVTRSIGTVTQDGDVFNAATMNDLETRIEAGFEDLGDCTFSVQSDGAYVTYTPAGGADSVSKKLGSSDLHDYNHFTSGATATSINLGYKPEAVEIILNHSANGALLMVRKTEEKTFCIYSTTMGYTDEGTTFTAWENIITLTSTGFTYTPFDVGWYGVIDYIAYK